MVVRADRAAGEEEAGKAKGGGGTVAVLVEANVQAVAILREMIERGDMPDTRFAERLQ